jgi:hypothetical protein
MENEPGVVNESENGYVATVSLTLIVTQPEIFAVIGNSLGTRFHFLTASD